MSEHSFSERDFGAATRGEVMAALFAQMVMQQTNMAMMLMGKVAHPQSGQLVHDLEAAQMFIDQLEMLQDKTKGNLGKEEEQLLKASLASVRMAFVEAVHSQRKEVSADPANPPAVVSDSSTAPAATPPSGTQTPEASAAAAEDESKKKFSKKY